MKLLRFIVPSLLITVSTALLIILGPLGSGVTFKDNFQKAIKPAWAPKTPDKWILAKESKNSFYQLKTPGDQDEGIMRPAEYSLVKGYNYTDFTFKCKLKCDAPADRRYRDVIIIFGYQDDTHFYYIHLSNISDDLHNAIMLVNGDYRRKLSKDTPEPTLIDLDFHKVKLKRKAVTGDIRVYFDGKLVMTAQDGTFAEGMVGVGSFDDVGGFDDVRIRGKLVEEAPVQ